MDKTLRRKRLRELVHKVRENKKQQDKKIDILCNDIISAHQDFIKTLGTIGFAANFYETLLGINDLKEFFCAAGKLIQQQVKNCQVVFFLRTHNDFEMYIQQSSQQDICAYDHVENGFTAELVDNICKSNKVCDLEEMFGMGLEGNLGLLKTMCSYSVPLIRFGASVGFILISRQKENPITDAELSDITSVTPGLSKAIESYQTLMN